MECETNPGTEFVSDCRCEEERVASHWRGSVLAAVPGNVFDEREQDRYDDGARMDGSQRVIVIDLQSLNEGAVQQRSCQRCCCLSVPICIS